MKTLKFMHSFVGNKDRESTEILENIDIDALEEVIEPFAGSFAVSRFIFHNSKNKNNIKFIINDIDEEHILLLQYIKIHGLKECITFYNENVNIPKEVFVTLIKEIKKIDDISQAYRIFFYKKFYNCRFGMFQQNEKRKKELKYEDYKDIEGFIESPNFVISQEDGAKLVQKLATEEETLNTLIYIDPPFFNTSNQEYNVKECGMKDEISDTCQQYKDPFWYYICFRDLLKSKTKTIMTINYSQLYEEFYKGFTINKYIFKYSGVTVEKGKMATRNVNVHMQIEN